MTNTIDQEVLNLLALYLDDAAFKEIRNNEYSFNDSAVRSKTLALASDMIRRFNDRLS